MRAKSGNSKKGRLRERVAQAKGSTAEARPGKGAIRLSFTTVKATRDEIDVSITPTGGSRA